MKLLHTSDWHLGRQFHNISLLQDQEHVLQQILNYVEVESVDAVLIAGDVYDRSVPPATAVALLNQWLTKLCDCLKVPVILIPGNHDSAERIGFGASQLRRAGIHIVASLDQITEPVILKDQQGEVHVYSIPYCDPETVRHHFQMDIHTHEQAHAFLVNKIHDVKENSVRNVLMSHCFVDGAETSESERPLSIGGADRVSFEPLLDFDYVALGHLHGPQFRGKPHIRYSGSPLKYSFSEHRQKKSVTLVSLRGKGESEVTQLPLFPQYDVRMVEGELNSILEQGSTDPNKHDYLLVRLTDRHALLEPMSKLRQVYPNVLHLEKPGMLHTAEQSLRRDALKRNELDMFKDFFQQVTGAPLDPPQAKAMQETLTQLAKSEVDKL